MTRTIPQLFDLKGKTALVTGGSRGIGRAIALELGRAGAEVVVGYRTGADEAGAVAAEIGGRAVQGFEPVIKGDPIVTVIMLAAPLAFLVGIGGFDYWGRWMIGRPTQPEDHSDHGARGWKDYFRVNTDHKVIGIAATVASATSLARVAPDANILSNSPGSAR